MYLDTDTVTFQMYPDRDTFEFNENFSGYKFVCSKNKNIRILSGYGHFFA